MSKNIPISSLIPDPSNANKGTERGEYMLNESIAETGLGRSVVVDKNGYLIAGNKTTEAAIAAGFEDAVIVETDGKKLVVVQRNDLDLTDHDPNNPARKLAYYDNRAGEVSLAWDAEQVLADIDAGMDLSGLFFEDELADLLAGIEAPQPEPQDAEPQTSRADELQAVWQVETGQMWRLPSRTDGQEHWIICGDCTDVFFDDIDTIITDPPYGMKLNANFSSAKSRLDFAEEKSEFGGNYYENVIGDFEEYDPRPLIEKYSKVKEQFWFGADYYAERLPNKNDGSWLVWDKRVEESMDAVYGSAFETVWSRTKHKRQILRVKWAGIFGMEKDDTRKRVHPTQKPTMVYQLIIDIAKSDIFADFYAGSGTAIIAAENLARQCRAVEISPAYVAVALQRYKDAFGIEPELMTDG